MGKKIQGLEVLFLHAVFEENRPGGGGGGELPKNMWRVCAATLTPIFKPPVTEWPPFYFSHFALT